MNVAIVAPSPVPFAIGGAENLAFGLFDAIRTRTPHRVELIKLPSPERTFREVIDSYRAWTRIDLSHFDRVISLKYPAWMAEHPDHVCYMLHPLRGLYDTYHYFGLPESLGPSPADGIRAFMRQNAGRREAIPELFSRLDALRAPELLQFPGPLIREVVHWLDAIGLAGVRRYAAISQTVAARKDYFPAGAEVRVAHPPSHLTGFRSAGDAALFTVSRLDGPKRVALLVEAMRHVRAQIPLRIAGTGPEEAKIKALAAGDPRIEFLGFVDDAGVIGEYANALAIPFVPLDEDWGLVAVEAMMSGKPVLTFTDSGGPNELVRNGETGFSVPPDPRALAEKIDFLAEHRDAAREMGRKARLRAEAITWEHVIEVLLDSKPVVKQPRRKRLTVALTFPVYPPRGGGQSRVYHLYRQLARYIDVDLISLAYPGEPPFEGEIAPGLFEHRVVKSEEHQRREWELEAEVKVPLTDVAMPLLYRSTPEYLEALRRSARGAEVVIASHPYAFPAIRAVTDKPIWYEAHNVESELKRAILPPGFTSRELLSAVEHVERACCAESGLIVTCAAEDGATLQRLYGANPAQIIEVPNGVDLETVRFVSPPERALAKQRLGLGSEVIAVFMGSWHGPNLDAVRAILGFAKQLPAVRFLVLGSSCAAFANEDRPANVGLLGVLDDEGKDAVLGVADLALNPVVSGSGTNLKMLDYFASGLPVISTPHGARGLTVRDGEHLVLAEVDRFPEAIDRVAREGAATKGARMARARQLAEEAFAWPVIASKFWAEISRRELL